MTFSRSSLASFTSNLGEASGDRLLVDRLLDMLLLDRLGGKNSREGAGGGEEGVVNEGDEDEGNEDGGDEDEGERGDSMMGGRPRGGEGGAGIRAAVVGEGPPLAWLSVVTWRGVGGVGVGEVG